MASTYTYYGHHDLSVIHVCIAIESLLSIALRTHLATKGMSDSHIDKYLRDATLSQMLNLHLPSILDLPLLPDHQKLLGDLNWVRKQRNDILHRGTPSEELCAARMNEVIASASLLLEKLVEQCGLPGA